MCFRWTPSTVDTSPPIHNSQFVIQATSDVRYSVLVWFLFRSPQQCTVSDGIAAPAGYSWDSLSVDGGVCSSVYI